VKIVQLCQELEGGGISIQPGEHKGKGYCASVLCN